MTLASMLTTDLANVFYQTDDFAELVSIGRQGKTTASVAVIFDDWMGEAKAAGHTNTTSTSPLITLPATSYKINTVQVDPRQGDTITRPSGAVYEVRAPSGKQCFEPHNDAQEILVHVVKVSS